jgi:phosphoribosyl-ATP pyrophosphohydrolase
MVDPIKTLYKAVVLARGETRDASKTAKLFDDGRIKIAKKLIEEAAEISLECVANNRDEVIHESVDMLYNWVVLLADMGIEPAEVWEEMARREDAMGIAGKIPKNGLREIK